MNFEFEGMAAEYRETILPLIEDVSLCTTEIQKNDILHLRRVYLSINEVLGSFAEQV